jgi:hypothetical protein
VTTIFLFAGVSPVAVKAISAHVIGVHLNIGVNPEAVRALSACVTMVFLNALVSSDAVKALSAHVIAVGLYAGVSPEAVKALSKAVKEIRIFHKDLSKELINAFPSGAKITFAHGVKVIEEIQKLVDEHNRQLEFKRESAINQSEGGGKRIKPENGGYNREQFFEEPSSYTARPETITITIKREPTW